MEPSRNSINIHMIKENQENIPDAPANNKNIAIFTQDVSIPEKVLNKPFHLTMSNDEEVTKYFHNENLTQIKSLIQRENTAFHQLQKNKKLISGGKVLSGIKVLAMYVYFPGFIMCVLAMVGGIWLR